MRQLPTEARRFNSVDQLWKKVRPRVLGLKLLPSQALGAHTNQAQKLRGNGLVPPRGGGNVYLPGGSRGDVVASFGNNALHFSPSIQQISRRVNKQ